MPIVDDETSRILGERSLDKWRQYALWEAKRVRCETIAAAYNAYTDAGGDLAATVHNLRPRSDPAYDALVTAIEAATLEYDQTCGEIQGEYARVAL